MTLIPSIPHPGPRGRRLFAAALFALVAASGPASADSPSNPMRWEPVTRSVAVFKDGLGFFVKQAEVSLRDGWCVSSDLPPAAFGTLAIYSLVEGHVVDLVGAGPGEIVEFDGLDAPDDLVARRARLESSIGLDVELTYEDDGERRAAPGKLESVGPRFAILESPLGHVAVPVEGVLRMQLLNLPLRIHVVDADGKPAASTILAMSYLQKGITWIPEYGLEAEGEEGLLSLRATLVNEALDLIHCDVHFMVGVPNFQHTDYLAPVAVGTVIRSLGAAVLPAEFRGQIMNRSAIVTNSISADQFAAGAGVTERRVDPGAGLGDLTSQFPSVDGIATGDYTVFSVPDLTVRKGERAIVALLQTRVRFSHVYEWRTPERMEHRLELHNDSETAWTTGPCLVLLNGQPVSQGMLRYTPIGGRCRLDVTTAVNVAHRQTEREADRKLKAHSPSRDRFLDLIRIAGELELKNLEPRSATVVIDVQVPGRPLSASHEGTFASDSSQLILGKRSGNLHWSVTLEPGESKRIEYAYERFVPSS